MKALLLAVSAAVFFAFSAQAAEIHLDDGTIIDVPLGSKVYIYEGQAFKFTMFSAEGFDIRPIEPSAEAVEVCDGFTFGGGSCHTEVVADETES